MTLLPAIFAAARAIAPSFKPSSIRCRCNRIRSTPTRPGSRTRWRPSRERPRRRLSIPTARFTRHDRSPGRLNFGIECPRLKFWPAAPTSVFWRARGGRQFRRSFISARSRNCGNALRPALTSRSGRRCHMTRRLKFWRAFIPVSRSIFRASARGKSEISERSAAISALLPRSATFCRSCCRCRHAYGFARSRGHGNWTRIPIFSIIGKRRYGRTN
jgi:hypothetical protein